MLSFTNISTIENVPKTGRRNFLVIDTITEDGACKAHPIQKQKKTKKFVKGKAVNLTLKKEIIDDLKAGAEMTYIEKLDFNQILEKMGAGNLILVSK